MFLSICHVLTTWFLIMDKEVTRRFQGKIIKDKIAVQCVINREWDFSSWG